MGNDGSTTGRQMISECPLDPSAGANYVHRTHELPVPCVCRSSLVFGSEHSVLSALTVFVGWCHLVVIGRSVSHAFWKAPAWAVPRTARRTFLKGAAVISPWHRNLKRFLS